MFLPFDWGLTMSFTNNFIPDTSNLMGEWFGFINQERVHWVCKHVQGDSILDIACGSGATAVLLACEGKQVLGIDTDPFSIAEANSLRQEEAESVQLRLSFLNADVMEYDFKGKKFDSIILAEVLEHLLFPEQLLRKVKSLLKGESSQVVITVPFGINDWPYNKITYYVGNLTKLVSGFFNIVEMEILYDRYLCLAATKTRVKDQGLHLTVEMAEEQFYGKEKALHESIYRQKETINLLHDELAKFAQAIQIQQELYLEIEELKKQLAETEKVNSVLRQELEQVQKQNNVYKGDVTDKKAIIEKLVMQVNNLRVSESFRIGTLIVEGLKNPLTVFFWPKKLVNYLIMRRARKLARENQEDNSAASTVGRVDPLPKHPKKMI
jgi:2-polyprenyl-6-hydroxyphenyl methylase/3-demethylubiquinone-9 3-methyltransferase